MVQVAALGTDRTDNPLGPLERFVQVWETEIPFLARLHVELLLIRPCPTRT